MTAASPPRIDLSEFVASGAIDEGDLLLAGRVARITGEQRPEVVLAAATCLAELRRGAVCLLLDEPPALDLTRSEGPPDASDGGRGDAEPAGAVPAWPSPIAWQSLLAGSPMVRLGEGAVDRPLRLVGRRVYLQRFWQDEETIRTSVIAVPDTTYAPEAVSAAVEAAFGSEGDAEQRSAAGAAARNRITLVAGGPGTGKTWTVARVLTTLATLADRELRVAVAAPTGKAATRLQEAIATESPTAAPPWLRALQPATIHRLLRRRPGTREAFRHTRDNPLPHDVVIVDEMSMVSLPLMARLMAAIGPATRVVLVGDPDQLASVEAGAVFGDLVRMRAGSAALVTLEANHRFSGQLLHLARAVRDGRVDDALAALGPADAAPAPGSGRTHDQTNVTFTESKDGREAFDTIRAAVVEQARIVDAAARAGDAERALAALTSFRVLCAHRAGVAGVARWSGLIDAWSAHATGRRPGADPWYAGRPLLVTRNDYDLGVFNGETGVVVLRGGAPTAVIDQGSTALELAPAQLDEVETMHAMTVHKAQGSQYRRVTVVLPPPGSPLLTRELLYTAITRAQEHVHIVGTREAVRMAVGRHIRRASGLGRPE